MNKRKVEIMNYGEVSEYIEERNKLGSVPGLDNIKGLLRRLGDPEKGIPAFHIAGTNGKGSIMAYVESVLLEAGLKVGRYISPTIIDYRERWQINKEYISKKACAEVMTDVISAVEDMEKEDEGRPTSFEIETAAAFLWFKRSDCDVILIECGMGGRLDATNVFESTPIDIIASISFDHMQFLGNTLEKITREKLGIVKKGDILVSYPQSEEPERIINNMVKLMDLCDEENMDAGSEENMDLGGEENIGAGDKENMDAGDKENMVLCGEENIGAGVETGIPEVSGYFKADRGCISSVEEGLDESSFIYKGERYTIHLAGGAQIYNAVTAIEAINAFNGVAGRYGFGSISGDIIKKGLEKTSWQGRFTVLSREPLFIVDGAHNEDAWINLSSDVRKYFTNRKLIYIMGVLKDKEYHKMLDLLTPGMHSAFTVTTDSPRALDGRVLAGLIRDRGIDAVFAESVDKAVKDAVSLAKTIPDSVIIACGTLSFVGDVIRAVK